jgi:hypothetical protein
MRRDELLRTDSHFHSSSRNSALEVPPAVEYAFVDDAADIAVGTLFTGLRRDVLIQDVALSQRREDDPTAFLLCFAGGAARLDTPKDRIRWNAFDGVGHVLPVPRHHFLAEPPLHRRFALQEHAHTVANHFANRSISTGLYLALDDLGHVEW